MLQFTGLLRPGNSGTCGILTGAVGKNLQFGMYGDPDKQPEELLKLIE